MTRLSNIACPKRKCFLGLCSGTTPDKRVCKLRPDPQKLDPHTQFVRQLFKKVLRSCREFVKGTCATVPIINVIKTIYGDSRWSVQHHCPLSRLPLEEPYSTNFVGDTSSLFDWERVTALLLNLVPGNLVLKSSR